jgi:hypothetical protein
MSKTESPAIEVEVLEIDGNTPQLRTTRETFSDSQPHSNTWATWQGRIRHLDRRWWPLWLLLGLALLTVVLTLGLVVGLITVILKCLQIILRQISRLMRP